MIRSFSISVCLRLQVTVMIRSVLQMAAETTDVFTFGESIQPSFWNKYNEDGIIHDENTSKYHIYITWQELQMMTDMGNAVYWHDVSPDLSQQDPS